MTQTGRWSLATPPVPGELLSGYLCRVAIARGTTPYGFCESELEDRSFWTRDSDRGVIRQQMDAVSRHSGLSADEVRALTLRHWLDMLAPRGYVKRQDTAIIPWVNVVGLYHRTRMHHGLQYCPLCLREDAVVPKAWRLSFVVHCPLHDIALRDACPHCDAPFVPHRAMGRLDMCHACGGWLIAVKSKETVSPTAIDLQTAMLARLTHPGDPAASSLGDADLIGIRRLVSVFLMKPAPVYWANQLGISEGAMRGPRFEMSRHPRRVALLLSCASILDRWPKEFLRLADRFNLTQRRFVRLRGSAWLDLAIAKLPERIVKPRVFGGVKRLSTLQRLEEKRPENWRALRAAALLRRVRRESGP
jgi:hypothetical protein